MSGELVQPIVSIIMPVYQCAGFVEDAVESVLRQTYRHWELIMIDDCSDDGSLDIACNLMEKDSRIRLMRNGKNLGAAGARNHALKETRGLYIAMLDSDDIWEAEKLEHQLDFMRTESVPFSFTGYSRISASGKRLKEMRLLSNVSYRLMLKANFLCTSSVMYDTRVLGHREFPDIRRRQDYGLWLQILKEINTARGLPERLVRYRVRRDSLSGSLFSRVHWNWRLHRDIMGCSLPIALYRLGWNIIIKMFIKP